MFTRALWSVFMFCVGWLSFGVGSAIYDIAIPYGYSNSMQVMEPQPERRVTIYSKSDNSFVVAGEIRDMVQFFYVDTGASHVTLTYENALELGLKPREYEQTCFETTNGTSCGYTTVLYRIRIGEISLRDVRVDILQPGKFRMNLLGMSFLSRLSRFEYNRYNRSLTLYQ